MTTDLKTFISGYISLSDTELEEITTLFKRRAIRKHDYLLRPGQKCKDLVFVQKGCLRLFYLIGDIEISVWFSFQHTSAIEIHSFISQAPSNYYLQAIEDTEILYLPKAELDQVYQSHPKMQEMMRKFWENAVLTLIDRFTALQRDSAEERYRDLLSKPAFLQTIPQKYLASFIGVTPTSLSRIRKKIR